MSVYYSSFISGFEDIVSTLIRREIPEAKNIRMLDGAVVYETDIETSKLQEIRCFNNTFLILKQAENATPEDLIAKVLSDKRVGKNGFPIPVKAFKLFVSVENKLVSIDKSLNYKLVERLKQLTKKPFDSRKADTEFWALQRSENISLFMLRLTKNKKKLERGELRPELTNLLCHLSIPSENDVFLDPFCGSGAIPLERSRIMDFKGIFAQDKNAELIQFLKERIKGIKRAKMQKSFFVKNQDFFENKFNNGFIDVIVTDPPWGIYEKIEADFYDKTMLEFFRILKPGGRMVLLTGTDNKIPMVSGLQQVKNFSILLSGQKARVYLFKKS